MEIISNSSLLVEKYRPKTVSDLILPDPIISLFKDFVSKKDIPNLLFSGTAGKGKTASALSLCNDIDCDVLFINASLETGIDTLRYKVQQFAMTSSFSDGKKIVILDELDRLGGNTGGSQDALKSLLEQVEANCRFIMTTNNIAKVIDPIKSRTQYINFNFSKKENDTLLIKFFKRVCFILDNEKINFDKKVLAEFCKKFFPDFRKTLNELQKFAQMHGCIDEQIFSNLDDSLMLSLVNELKNKKFNNVRKIATDIEPSLFYSDFYKEIDNLLLDECKPNIIISLAESSYKSAFTANKEIELVSCLIQIMRDAKWR